MQFAIRRKSGLSVLFDLNVDRVLTVCMVVGGLFLGAFLATLIG